MPLGIMNDDSMSDGLRSDDVLLQALKGVWWTVQQSPVTVQWEVGAVSRPARHVIPPHSKAPLSSPTLHAPFFVSLHASCQARAVLQRRFAGPHVARAGFGVRWWPMLVIPRRHASIMPGGEGGGERGASGGRKGGREQWVRSARLASARVLVGCKLGCSGNRQDGVCCTGDTPGEREG